MAYLLTKTKNRKIIITKFNSENKKQKQMSKYPQNTIECIDENSLLKELRFKEKNLISELILSPIYEFFLDTITSCLINDISKEIVKYMKTNNAISVIYNFQPEYYNENNVIDEKNGCKIVDNGTFRPLEYEILKDFTNEPTKDGEIRYDRTYQTELFFPSKIGDDISKNININQDKIFNTLIDNIISEELLNTLEISKTINIDFLKFFIKTECFKEYVCELINNQTVADILNGSSSSFYKTSFYEIYKNGCDLLGEKPVNIEYVDEFNEYYRDLIFESFKKLNIEDKISISDFKPERKNIQKKINKLKKETEKIISEKIIYSQRLLNKRFDSLKSILLSVYRYEKFCKKNNFEEIEIFDSDDILKEIAKIQAIIYEREEILVNISDILAIDSCVNDLFNNGIIYVTTYTYVKEETKKNIIDLIPSSPEKEYPLTRLMKRKFFIHYGPTNSGKTYDSIEKLKQAKSGIYLSPLRLLALEIQDKLNNNNVPCSLLTGEEEDIIPNANHMSSTVEKLIMTERYDVCVIDECQMINDPERGFAWTRAILGVLSENIYLCTGPEALDILISLINLCGDSYELIEHKRRSELVVQKPIKLKENDIEKYDAYIVFSKKKVLAVTAELIKKGIKASMIYGNLPYPVRKKQVERFLNGDTDVIVSTNAIGMGINLPVRRIIFLEDQKFNGKIRDNLTITDIKQIAGRAGRNKETGLVTSTMESNNFIQDVLFKETPPLKQAYLGFSDEIINIEAPLSDILKVWKSIETPSMFKRMDISRYIELDEKIYVSVSKKEKLKMLSIAFDERNPRLLSLWKEYCFNYDSNKEFEKPSLKGLELSDYEDYYQALELYYSFCKNFGQPIDINWLHSEKTTVSEKINEILVKDTANFQRTCESCGKPMPWDSPYKTCKRCYLKQKRKSYYF